ncbi:hypothetical protein EXIGLDRAFT_729594 [Exidia glandulosa HHB12029]|uniref:Uncharacterized protein n=1 Tax=Exidia glandulosa HHB12029 TaxID=1314781 RepID=A0A165CHM8_EXIGL|nr:hypothetical protein EXIGLDRAFT_729594 [Exidia glandulosa HHB12029]
MKCLRHLSLDIPSYYAPLFGNQFRQDRLAMRRVRSAVVAPYCEFVIHFSPNISSVSTNEKWWLDPKGNPALRLITAAGTTVTIVEFEAHFDQWTVPLAEALRHALPNVRALTIRGQCPLSKILTIVIKMKSIEKLVLADIDYLDFRRDTKRGTSAEERVAAVVAPRMKALQTLRVGESTFEVIREKHGAYKGLEKQS